MAGCDEYAELLSARQDGELDAAEAALLDDHLRDCAECGAMARRLAKVDFIIDSADQLVGTDRVVAAPDSVPHRAMRDRIEDAMRDRIDERLGRIVSPPRRRVAPRAVQFAAAALILIAVSLVILITGDQADAGLIAPHVTALEKANDETIKNQDALLDTLEWDLNAMKLEVRCADLDEQSSSKILERIDALLQEVESTRLDDIKNKGEDK